MAQWRNPPNCGLTARTSRHKVSSSHPLQRFASSRLHFDHVFEFHGFPLSAHARERLSLRLSQALCGLISAPVQHAWAFSLEFEQREAIPLPPPARNAGQRHRRPAALPRPATHARIRPAQHCTARECWPASVTCPGSQAARLTPNSILYSPAGRGFPAPSRVAGKLACQSR